MSDQRKSYTPEFKLKVVLESMQRDTTQEHEKDDTMGHRKLGKLLHMEKIG
jgi:hypothetical protein